MAASEPTRLAVLSQQPGELLTGVAAELHQVADHHPFGVARECPILELGQFSLNPEVTGSLVTQDRKGHRLGAGEKIHQLVNRREVVECHDGLHPPS